MNPSGEIPQEQAFRQVLAHRTMLKACVQAIVRNPTLAEDTFSDVTLEIVRSWERFDQARPFEPWARGVARRVSLANLRKEGRQPIALDEAVLESVGEQLDQFGGEAALELRKEALAHCLGGLSETNRELIQLRYFQNRSYDHISQTLGRTAGALYAALSRIHSALLDCVRRTLKTT